MEPWSQKFDAFLTYGGRYIVVAAILRMISHMYY